MISGTVVVPGGTDGVPGVVGSDGCGVEGVRSVGCGDGGGLGAGATGVLVGGAGCCPFCVCGAAVPAQQLSSTSDELLKSSKRFL